jgi:hypothetical protein
MVEAVDAIAVAREQLAQHGLCMAQSLENVPTVSEKVPWTRTSIGPPSAAAGTGSSFLPLPLSASSVCAESW